MSRHTTYRGATIDMDSMRRENEKVPALGNMGTNAKGDKLSKGGVISKTADQIARENHRVQSTIIKSGLKGPVPNTPQPSEQKQSVKPTIIKQVEVELPGGDIIVKDGNDL